MGLKQPKVTDTSTVSLDSGIRQKTKMATKIKRDNLLNINFIPMFVVIYLYQRYFLSRGLSLTLSSPLLLRFLHQIEAKVV